MKIKLRNEIGSISIMNDGCATDDNLAIALGTYFEGLPECPEDDFNDELGWSQWAIDKTNDILDRIVKQFLTSHAADLKSRAADLNRYKLKNDCSET